jgi:FixJ family two-component response regulator
MNELALVSRFQSTERCEPPSHVYVVDDEAMVRDALARLLRSADYQVSTFDSAEAFLADRVPGAAGCLLLDLGLPGVDGLSLQQSLAADASAMPVIFLTGRGDVPTCAQAMKSGAIDFLMKPVQDEVLFAAVERALALNSEQRGLLAHRVQTESRLATLTPREREVLLHVMAGRLNKQIAADLGTAEKTIKVHRARGMEKMQVRSVAELVRVIERTRPQGFEPAH